MLQVLTASEGRRVQATSAPAEDGQALPLYFAKIDARLWGREEAQSCCQGRAFYGNTTQESIANEHNGGSSLFVSFVVAKPRLSPGMKNYRS